MEKHQNMWCIILGPSTEDGVALHRWPKIEQELQKHDLSYSVRFADKAGHATRLTDDAILDGYRQILGIGGEELEYEIGMGIAIGLNEHPEASQVIMRMLPFGFKQDLSKPWRIGRVRAMLKKLEMMKG
jgi:diacylglycerol kinase family enzyme